ALHPLHVESVAWISERKDVLSGFFFLLTLIAYVKYVDQFKVLGLKFKVSEADELRQEPSTFNVQGSRFKVFLWYILALLWLALGLMAKPMLVTVPFVLLLLDYWPLERFAQFRVLSSKFKASNLPATTKVTDHASLITHHVSRFALLLVVEKIPFFVL